MSASPGRTRAKAANTCCCRPATRARYRRAITLSGRRRSATGSPGAASWSMATRNPGVDLVKKFTKIYPLSQAAQSARLKFVDVSNKSFNTVAPADYTFWEALNQVVQEEPTDPIDPTTLGFCASIGIKKGKPFAPDERMKKILTEAARVGDATARAIVFRWRTADGYYYPNSAWRLGVPRRLQVRGKRGASTWTATRASSSMPLASPRRWIRRWSGAGRSTLAAFVDSQGNPLGRREELSAAPAAQHPGQEFLVGHPVRQPDPLDAPDRSASARASAARPRDSWSTPTGRWTSISDPRPRPARRRTGCRPSPARAGTPSCASMARWSRGSTRPGGRGRSNSSRDLPTRS